MATAKKTSPSDGPPPTCSVRFFDRHQKRKNTAGQPRPTSSRFAPVMLAVANDAYSGSWGARHAKKMSTAYSGSTAIRAMAASASPCETSFSAASEAQVMMKAAATIPIPKMPTSTPTPGWAPAHWISGRSTMAGMQTVAVTAIRSQFLAATLLIGLGPHRSWGDKRGQSKGDGCG